jgi:hypothetical protein
MSKIENMLPIGANSIFDLDSPEFELSNKNKNERREKRGKIKILPLVL